MAINNSQLSEGSELGDLRRLVQPILSIDEFRSKMGDDKDIVVLGFTVMGKEPADDLVNFVEKSYDWVLDADLSSGEASDGNYIVFIEVERNDKVVDEIVTMMGDMMNLTEQDIKDWTFTYYNKPTKYPLTKDELTKQIITKPLEYETKMSADVNESYELNSLRALANVTVKPAVIKDLQIIDLQIAAGIR